MALHASMSKLGLLILNSALASAPKTDPPLCRQSFDEWKNFFFNVPERFVGPSGLSSTTSAVVDREKSGLVLVR